MSSKEWKKVKLSEIAYLNYGKSLTSDIRKEGKIPVYSSSGITGWHDTALVIEDGIVIGRKGNVGSIFYADGPFYCIDTAYYIKKSELKCNIKYFYYLLKTLGLDKLNEDSAVPGLSRDTAHSQLFSYPEEIDTQRRIADILSALDDKIELNRQTNATLEAIAQAIFKKWFVENEKAYEWDLAPLPEVIEINPPCSLKANQIAPYLDMASMPTTGHRVNGWVNRPFGSGTKFINGDTLIAKITPCLENGKTAYVDFLDNGQIGWGSTEYIIFRPKPPIPPEYGYFLARSDEIRNYAIQNMIGTSGRQRVPVTCFNFLSIRIPPTDLVIQFGIIAESLMKKIKATSEESKTLAFIRDTLLPKLMSGEIYP